MVCEQNYRELSKLQSFFRFYCGWGGGKVKYAAVQGAFAKSAFRRDSPRLRRGNFRDWIAKVRGWSREGRGACSYILEKPSLFSVWRGARAQVYVVGTWVENWLKGLKHAPIIYVCMSLEKCFNPSAPVPNPLEIGGKVAEGLSF